MDTVGLFQFDHGWRQRIEASLPKLALRIAAASGLDPAIDGMFEVSSDRRCNAAAFPGPRFRINEGAILGLIDLALALAADETFATDRGTIPTRISPRKEPEVHRRFFDYTRKDNTPGYPDLAMEVPKDRVPVFSEVYLSGLSFLILHEQGHYLEGHLAYCKTKWGATEWLEATESGHRKGPVPLTACALEWGADAFAISTYLYSAVRGAGAAPLTREWLHNNENNVVQYFVGAAAAMALLSYVDRQINRDPGERRHPSPAFRYMTLETAFEAFLRGCGCADEEIDTLFSRALHECRPIYRLLGVTQDLAFALQARMGVLADNHHIQIERRNIAQCRREIEADLEQAKQSVAVQFSR